MPKLGLVPCFLVITVLADPCRWETFFWWNETMAPGCAHDVHLSYLTSRSHAIPLVRQMDEDGQNLGKNLCLWTISVINFCKDFNREKSWLMKNPPVVQPVRLNKEVIGSVEHVGAQHKQGHFMANVRTAVISQLVSMQRWLHHAIRKQHEDRFV